MIILATKKDGVISFVEEHVQLETGMLDNRGHSQEDNHHVLPLNCGPRFYAIT